MKKEEAVKALKRIRDEAMNEFVGELEDYEAFDVAIESLKAQEWIPVSEKLPEEEGSYLITSNMADELKEVLETFYIPASNMADGMPYWDYSGVIAWMPLPEPYKAESEDKEWQGGGSNK